jgi:hypothetical protein
MSREVTTRWRAEPARGAQGDLTLAGRSDSLLALSTREC